MAFFTKINHTDLNYISKLYGINFISHEGIAEGSENSNYVIKSVDKSYILTLFENRVKKSDLPFFMNVSEFWHQQGLAVPKPLTGIDGGKYYSLHNKPLAIVEFLQGRPLANYSPQNMRELGLFVRKMHDIGVNYPDRKINDMGLSSWQEMLPEILAADYYPPEMARYIEKTAREIFDYWSLLEGQLSSSIIHGDIFPDNVFFESGNLSGIIDIYFSCYYSRLYELAVIVNSWCFSADFRLDKDMVKALFAGYGEFEQDELMILPQIMKAAALRFLLTRSLDMVRSKDAEIMRGKNPIEYLRKLRFHDAVKNHLEYGLRTPQDIDN